MRITVIGAGAFGTALARILTHNYHTINFFDPYKFARVSLGTAIKDAEIIVLAAPSNEVGQLLKFLPKNIPLICASKGLLDKNILIDFPLLGILAGPSFAEQLNKREATVFTITSSLIGRLFAADFISFQHTDDTYGVMLCGALKNLYAFQAGRWRLSPEKRDFLYFIASAHREMQKILSKFQCDPMTSNLACGIDDLILTCSSECSRNYQLGEIFEEYSAEELKEFLSERTVESINIARSFAPQLRHLQDCPIAYDIIETLS